MKAIRVREWGGPDVLRLEEVPDLRPGPGEVLVRIHAAGVNPVETYVRSGKYPKLPELPYTPGTDGAGVVEEIHPDFGSSGWLQPGTRVYLQGSLTGTYAERCLCKPAQLFPLPEEIEWAQGAALGIPYATACRALFQRARVQSGHTVLIHGGTGGVGLAAIQFAAAAGCTVFATGGSAEGRELMRQNGAQEVFDHHAKDYLDAVRNASGPGGINAILEMLANVNLGRDLSLLAPKGCVVVIGSRGPIEIDPRELMMREADIRGLLLFQASTEEHAEIHDAIGKGLRDGTLRPVIQREFPLADAASAHEAVMASGSVGKVVLVP